MSIFSLVMISMVLAAPEGKLAYVAGMEQEGQQAKVLDISSGNSIAVGFGNQDGAPIWSPDGRWLAFETHTQEGYLIAVCREDGAERRVLKNQADWNRGPRWDPEGKRLVYEADLESGKAAMVYDLATDTETRWGKEDAPILQPLWLPTTGLMKAMNPEDKASPAAAALFVLSEEAEKHGVLLACAIKGTPGNLSTEPVLVTPTQVVPMLPLVSKDTGRYREWALAADRKGRQIAYESNDGGDREIYVLGKRGVANVSNHFSADWNPVWSADGQWLLFESFRNGRRGVYKALVGTANVTPVMVSEEYDCWAPVWAPKDKWVAYVSEKEGVPQIFASLPDGKEAVQLTHETGYALAPAWQPVSH